jgi:hypothetical protein
MLCRESAKLARSFHGIRPSPLQGAAGLAIVEFWSASPLRGEVHMTANKLLAVLNIKSHNQGQVMDTLGDAGLMFYSAALRYLDRGPR